MAIDINSLAGLPKDDCLTAALPPRLRCTLQLACSRPHNVNGGSGGSSSGSSGGGGGGGLTDREALAADTKGVALVVSPACWHRIMCLACYERYRHFVGRRGARCSRCGRAAKEFAIAFLIPEEQALALEWEAGHQQPDEE